MFRFSPDQKEFIKANVVGLSNADLTRQFNAHFGLTVRETQIKSFKKNNLLSSGLTGRFEKGRMPFNKGQKRTWAGGEDTQFRMGHKPHNYMPVGSERVNADGYVDLKIADPNKWRGKHLIEWEKHNGGSIPKGHAVIFGDGNRTNFEPDNLIMVSRAQLAVMNRRGLIQCNADLTRTGVIMADIYRKIGERKRSDRADR
ncbi:HNH endonuclease signature motif containing protein [Paenibacillus sinopodophylli]|uniref:HNH endonuclease signature motif containing protein n=1 Tax=Paenibacillus sinopodophylli TaxID=1837342 RepID=UPI00110C8E9C|nr:HNH endonuclease signature motif containing protein [Paenibacillus sinopodophylli]